jgi:hypothetical protein
MKDEGGPLEIGVQAQVSNRFCCDPACRRAWQFARAGRLENTYGLGGGGFQIVKQSLLVLVGINLLRDPFDREVGETLFLT